MMLNSEYEIDTRPRIIPYTHTVRFRLGLGHTTSRRHDNRKVYNPTMIQTNILIILLCNYGFNYFKVELVAALLLIGAYSLYQN